MWPGLAEQEESRASNDVCGCHCGFSSRVPQGGPATDVERAEQWGTWVAIAIGSLWGPTCMLVIGRTGQLL